MEVILLERVDKLGQMGDVVTVKNGYARNYLLPQKKALRSTPENKAYFETQRKELEARSLKARQEAEEVAEKISGKSLVMLRQAGEGGQLYGSVSSRDVFKALTDDGVIIERNQVTMETAIKEIGLHVVPIRLHPDVSVEIQVNVARSSEEAEQQLDALTAAAAEEVFETEELAHAAEEALSEAPAGEEEAEETAGEETKEEVEVEAAQAEKGDEAEAEEDDAAKSAKSKKKKK